MIKGDKVYTITNSPKNPYKQEIEHGTVVNVKGNNVKVKFGKNKQVLVNKRFLYS